MRWVALAVVWVTGCYSPTLRDCTVACASAADCAAGQVCGDDGYCATPAVAGSCAEPHAEVDAASEPPMPDASQLCELGCVGGTCDEAGICVIDCSAPDSCPTDVRCPPNIPCRVICGDRSCDHHVDCRTAPTCEVLCVGVDACGDQILCNLSACSVTCSGERSCKHVIKCKDACACDATCTGTSSCAEISECPLGTACQLGRGCSSQLAGCDRCP